MPRAVILNTASKASLTGGTFADSLAANSGDSLTVANYQSGGARVIEMWGIDSATVAELQVLSTRPETSHDSVHGIRVMIPSTILGGAGNNGAFDLLPGYNHVPLWPADTLTMQVSGTAADAVVVSWLTEYDDLGGISGSFATYEQVMGNYVSTIGFRCDAVASATKGAYGAARAIATDDDRFHAKRYYAILGYSVQTEVCTVALKGPDWGGQLIGGPAGVLFLNTRTIFLDWTLKYQKPLIPWFSAENKGNVFVYVADDATSTSPKIDFHCIEMSAAPA